MQVGYVVVVGGVIVVVVVSNRFFSFAPDTVAQAQEPDLG
jgi:hypothetical protein